MNKQTQRTNHLIGRRLFEEKKPHPKGIRDFDSLGKFQEKKEG